MTSLAAYLLLFLAIGVGFIFIHLVAGMLIRPDKKHPEKETIYECGEPTIGSAWIQFDLRFYVVALLFVIFDVEVAFFFPWAEIFGKANAIHATPDPKTREEYKALAAVVNALSTPRGSISGTPLTPGVKDVETERQLWRALENMSEVEFAAIQRLHQENKALLQMLTYLDVKNFNKLRNLTPAELATIRQQAALFDQALSKIIEQIRAEAATSLAALEKLSSAERNEIDKALQPRAGEAGGVGGPMAPPQAGSMPLAGLSSILNSLRHRPNEINDNARALTLENLETFGADRLNVFPVSDRIPVLNKYLPGRIQLHSQQAAEGAKQIQQIAAQARAALNKAHPDQAELWNMLTLERMQALSKGQGTTNPLAGLTPEGVRALQTPLVKYAKDRSASLGLMALVEILVFFGVLLVGFAYLWKRGDLAWVRSTATEAALRQSTPTPRELQAAATSR